MNRVIIESPWQSESYIMHEIYEEYLDAAIRDCIRRGEAPFASCRMYAHLLHDHIPDEREKGIEMGLLWGELADKTVVYEDYGVSPGMQIGIDAAKAVERPIEQRRLYLKEKR